MRQNPHFLLTFNKVHNPLRLPRKTSLQGPKVARTCGVLQILTWKCASRHNGVQFFISHLASWLRTRPSLLFDLPEPQIIGKTVFRDFPTFSRTWIFFLLTLSRFDLRSSSLLFSDSSHLCFSSVQIIGSLTSKLPSII